ncbi:MAG: septum formation inhibitor Maf [Firmicutes bacterium]|jgi:septum formation protein|nr:septum formation inhibitor Maf [Bacillota bacterium]
MSRLVLASQSPRRQELLQSLGVDFLVVPAAINENSIQGKTPAELAEATAYAKARWVREEVRDGIIIAADTMVVLDEGEILGKPRGKQEAMDMLSRLSGEGHRVITGVAVMDPESGKEKVFHEITRVFFRRLSSAEIERYVDTGEPLDKAGAYGIQGKGALLVERIEGCYFNVVGLPLARLGQALMDFGIPLL